MLEECDFCDIDFLFGDKRKRKYAIVFARKALFYKWLSNDLTLVLFIRHLKIIGTYNEAYCVFLRNDFEV